jgi:hypothetical protein
MNEEYFDPAPDLVKPIQPVVDAAPQDVLQPKRGNVVPVGGSIQSNNFIIAGAYGANSLGWQANPNGSFYAAKVILTRQQTPTTATKGEVGELAWDQNNLYIMTLIAAGNYIWRKVPHSAL